MIRLNVLTSFLEQLIGYYHYILTGLTLLCLIVIVKGAEAVCLRCYLSLSQELVLLQQPQTADVLSIESFCIMDFTRCYQYEQSVGSMRR